VDIVVWIYADFQLKAINSHEFLLEIDDDLSHPGKEKAPESHNSGPWSS